ncbi:hypothetical protein SYNTR_1881 [Candidatus Syntrophocurvum alkaliphilum]|uniref:SLH domain-containing protein n=1 Tax=Candidatus Syntrophocurvum alkaliphilum TaxID=2293317 RepID=A0A6I6DCU9_9FIRM|nr:S-layer homology domain-containing protein [Candidatus Syntrophocurvum alkaliphilum]QGU00475.1 hypothetical protein SYNTR_1881 [Candidatus Syntrophocurvum alkaliphilum]
MLKKNNKLITIFILAFFMFSIVVSAGAAQFSDVDPAADATPAIYKLAALGILEGYPDGTFAPDNTITRAEFAKVAVVTAGLERVAIGMMGVPTQFNDVAADHWASGWINVAAAQEFVQGDGDGTFRPQDQITQAEVVTVLLRILGYNDNLTGNWPSNYISKATSLGVLDDITFIANKAATRGEVALIGSEVLEQNVVVYEASNNLFREDQRTFEGEEDNDETRSYSLLEDNFESAVETDELVVDVSLDDGIAFEFKSGEELELTETAIIANVPSWNQVKERFVDYITNDDGDIVYISVQDYGTVKASPEDIEINNEDRNEVDVDGTNYRLIDEVADMVYLPDTTVQLPRIGDYDYKANLESFFERGSNGEVFDDEFLAPVDTVEFVLDEDGRIALIKAWTWSSTNAGVVDNVNLSRERVQYKNSDVRTTNLADDDYKVLINGLPAELEDIQENDIVYETDLYDVTLLVVMSVQVPGELEFIRTTQITPELTAVTEVRVNGMWFDVALGGFMLSADAGSDFYDAKIDVNKIDDKYELLGEDVVLLMNPEQKVVGIISDVDATDRNFGIVDGEASVLDGNQEVEGVSIFRADGSVATYVVEDKEDFYDSGDIKAAKVDALIKYSINSDGELELEENFKPSTAYWAFETDTDNNILTVVNSDVVTVDVDDEAVTISEGSSFDISNTAIFNLHRDDDDLQTVEVADFLDAVDGETSYPALIVVDGNTIEYIVITDPNLEGTTVNIAMVIDTGRDVDGEYAYLLLPQGEVKYYIDEGPVVEDEVLMFTLKQGEIVADDSGWYPPAGPYEVKSISGNIFEVITANAGEANEEIRNFVVDNDTIYYDNENSPVLIEKDDIARGDIINLYREIGETAVAVVELVDDDLTNLQAIFFSLDLWVGKDEVEKFFPGGAKIDSEAGYFVSHLFDHVNPEVNPETVVFYKEKEKEFSCIFAEEELIAFQYKLVDNHTIDLLEKYQKAFTEDENNTWEEHAMPDPEDFLKYKDELYDSKFFINKDETDLGVIFVDSESGVVILARLIVD